MSGTGWLPKGPVRKTGRVKDVCWKKRKDSSPLALDIVNLSTVHRTRKEKKKTVDDKAPRVLRPADKSIHIREEEPTVATVWRQ